MTTALSRESLFPSVWAGVHRTIADLESKLPVPFSCERFPWIRDYMDDFAPQKVAKKPAQFGFTEGELTSSFHTVIVERASVLYTLPTNGFASDFSASRFDPAIEMSPTIAAAFSDVSNVGHKRAGSANLWIRGANADGLRGVDPRRLKLDESNEMDPSMIALACERITGQVDGSVTMLSTPTRPKYGIDLAWDASDRKKWLVPCRYCRHRVFLSWGEVKWDDDDPATARVECPRCGARWTEDERKSAARAGAWVAERPQFTQEVSGYWVTRACSLTMSVASMVERYLAVRYEPTKLEHVMNGFGVSYAASGMQLTPEVVLSCVRDYDLQQAALEGGCSMGVDVGSALHYRISARRDDPRDPRGAGRRVLRAGIVRDFEELDGLMRSFGVACCVIDANPERRKAREFQTRWGGPTGGRVFLAFYPDMRDPVRWDEKDGDVQINRTEAMDATLARFRYPADGALPAGTIDLPRGLPADFADQLCAPVRTYEERKAGPVAVYVENGPDHYAHASLYDEMAALRAAAPASGAIEPKMAAEVREREQSLRNAGWGTSRPRRGLWG